ASLRRGRRKTFMRGGKNYPRLTEHIGHFPLVLLSPSDINLVTGEPADRRRFIDQLISQRDARYLDALIRYNSALEQRNRLLRDQIADTTLYEALEAQMEMAGSYITAARAMNIDRLQQIFSPFYGSIADNGEKAIMAYKTSDYSAAGGLAAHMAVNRRRDTALGYTASGPHRDDIEFTIDGLPVRRSASQGQTKTFTSAIRFAQYELLREALGIKPLLLLDDIFDKLDAGRVSRIMGIVGTTGSFGQIFITDTNRRHLDEIVADIPSGPGGGRLWHVDSGTFTPLAL
ncbi:MAG: DNA replication and repair protein RecF, partial [Muribaculaceae bacterium]|nr:DNA replication and repair protein RecF [Muribaculaceae bacterium]